MPPPSQLQLQAVAYISPQNHPILIRPFVKTRRDDLKFHYIAHTSLDVIEERISANPKATDCYLGFLYSMDDCAIYGYITPLKVKMVLALSLSDTVVRDADVSMIFRAFHMAYYKSLANPFLLLNAPPEYQSDHCSLLPFGNKRTKAFKKRVDDVGRSLGAVIPPDDS